MKTFIKYLFVFLCCCFSLQAAAIQQNSYETTTRSLVSGSTDAYLKEIPFSTIIHLYTTHETTKDDPSLIQFAHFFEKNQTLFSTITQTEKSNTRQYYVFYHGVNGQRLLFDTLRVLYNHTHRDPLPQNFLLLRDPLDPAIRTDDLKKTLTTRWPIIPIKHQKVIIEAIVHHSVDMKQVPLLWKLFSGDIDWNEDLSPQERALLKGFSQQSILEYQHSFLGLARLDWKDPDSHLSTREKKDLMAIDTQVSSLGYELALRALYVLENNVDYTPLFRPRNLAVNLSLFSGCISYNPALGLYPTKHECTPLYWFAENLGYHQFETAHTLRDAKLLPILERYGIPSSELKQLEAIYSTLKPEDDQLLLQIFVPKEQNKPANQRALNHFFYISHPVGRPAYYLDPLLASQVLDLYQRTPILLPGFLQLQGRFVFTSDGLLSPQSGIRMFVYYLPSASQERIQHYLFLLDQWGMRQF